MSDKFWDEGIAKTLKKDAFLPFFIDYDFLARLLHFLFPLSFEITGADEDTLESSQAEIVVALGTELVQAQVEERDDLSTQLLGSLEALRVKLDSGDHFLVWLAHCHLSEQLLQVIGEIGPTGISWVHGDEDTHCLVELHIFALKVDDLLILFQTGLDCQNRL